MKGKVKTKRGLTLLELLVVIGIIVLLALVVSIVATPIKRRATLIVCRNNFRQIHMAVQAYREDYEGIEPNGQPLSREELGLPTAFFGDLIRGGYIKDRRIFDCPEETVFKEFTAITGVGSLGSYIFPVPGDLSPELARQHFRRCVALKRSKVAILIDPWHNPPDPPYAPGVPTPFFPKWELVLRLDGQIELVLVNDYKSCR